MYKSRIFYVFRRPVLEKLEQVKKRQMPEDAFYGFTQLSPKFAPYTTDQHLNSKTLLFLQRLINNGVLNFIDMGFSLLPSLFLVNRLKQANIVFATTDTYGLPLALFKSYGLFRSPLVFNTIGLYDAIVRKNNFLALSVVKWLVKQVDMFVSGGSMQECQLLANLLNIPIERFIFIPFGIDTNFFQPGNEKVNNEVLIIGADPSRDWNLYAHIIQAFPQENFRIVTLKGLVKIPMPKNVIFEYNLSYSEVKHRILSSKFLLILSKLNYHFAGQSTAMRAMSCGKTVIFTKTPGVMEYNFKNKTNCMMVPPGNLPETIYAIKFLNKFPELTRDIGKKARSVITAYYSIEQYGKKLNQVFLKALI